LEELIDRYGLLAVFIGCVVEGDITLVLTGVVVHLGLLAAAPAVAIGAAGLITEDSLLFALGRKGREAMQKRAQYQRVAARIEGMARRLGPRQIAAARVVYGTRAATMLFWGAQNLSWGRFLSIDAPACAAWSLLLAAVGYSFSNATAVLLGDVKRIELLLLAAAVLAGALLASARILGHRSG